MGGPTQSRAKLEFSRAPLAPMWLYCDGNDR